MLGLYWGHGFVIEVVKRSRVVMPEPQILGAPYSDTRLTDDPATVRLLAGPAEAVGCRSGLVVLGMTLPAELRSTPKVKLRKRKGMDLRISG